MLGKGEHYWKNDEDLVFITRKKILRQDRNFVPQRYKQH